MTSMKAQCLACGRLKTLKRGKVPSHLVAGQKCAGGGLGGYKSGWP